MPAVELMGMAPTAGRGAITRSALPSELGAQQLTQPPQCRGILLHCERGAITRTGRRDRSAQVGVTPPKLVGLRP